MDADGERRRFRRSRSVFGSERTGRRREHLGHAIDTVLVKGLWLELGGSTSGATGFIEARTGQTVYGFDWVKGPPEARECTMSDQSVSKGSFRGRPVAGRPDVSPCDEPLPDTLPAFLDLHPSSVALLHADCDLCRSASHALQERFVVGTVIAFDDLSDYPSDAKGHQRALLELVARIGLEYRYLGHLATGTAASMQVTRVPSPAAMVPGAPNSDDGPVDWAVL